MLPPFHTVGVSEFLRRISANEKVFSVIIGSRKKCLMTLRQRLKLLIIAIPLTAAAHDEIFVLNFQTHAGVLQGSVPISAGNGTVVSGQIFVDLAFLPAAYVPQPHVAFYTYAGSGRPGYVFQFTTGTETVVVDSRDSDITGGAASGIMMQIHTGDVYYYDSLEFQMRATEGQSYFSLQLLDLGAPYMLNELTFPYGINNLDTLHSAHFRYYGTDGFFSADISSMSYAIVPEPSVWALLALAACALIWQGCARRARRVAI